MPTIIEPTAAEVLAAKYLYERDKLYAALEVAFEAIDRLREVAEGKHSDSASEIAYTLNRAQTIIEEAFLLCDDPEGQA